MMTQLISTQMNVQLAFCVAHICSGTLVLSWPSDTIPVLCYTCNTSTISIKDAHLTVLRQPAEDEDSGGP